MKVYHYIGLFYLLVSLGCTEKEMLPKAKMSCQEFMDSLQFLSISYDVKFAYPAVNPNNADQFSYVKCVSSREHELFIHDLKNGSSRKIGEDVVFGQPVWSKDGNIYFINKEYAIIQLNPITKVTRTIIRDMGIIAYLTPSPSGSSLLFQRVQPDSLKALIVSTQGAIEKQFYYHTDTTLCLPYYKGYWYKGNNAVGVTRNGSVSIFDLDQVTSIEIVPFVGNSRMEISRVFGCNKCNHFYALKHGEGLWRINMPSKVSTLVKPSCILNEYESISLIDDTHAIVNKTVCTPLHYSYLHCSSKIYLLNLYTGVEKEIVLP